MAKLSEGPALQYVRGEGWKDAVVDPSDVGKARAIGTNKIRGVSHRLFMVERTMVAQAEGGGGGEARAVGRRRRRCVGARPKAHRGIVLGDRLLDDKLVGWINRNGMGIRDRSIVYKRASHADTALQVLRDTFGHGARIWVERGSVTDGSKSVSISKVQREAERLSGSSPRYVGRARKPSRRGKRKPKLSRVRCPHHGPDVGCMLCDDRGLIPVKDLPRRRPSRVRQPRRVGGVCVSDRDVADWLVELAVRTQTIGDRYGHHVWIGRVRKRTNMHGVTPGWYVFVAEDNDVTSSYGPYRTVMLARKGVVEIGFVGKDDPRILPPKRRYFTVRGRRYPKAGAGQ